MPNNELKYVLMTAARNEEAVLENTIKSVVSQTTLPARWIIVSDGSTDQTDNIVKKYAAQYDWIQLIRMPDHRDYQFAAKVHCIETAWKEVRTLSFDAVGNLDADVTFEANYVAFLLDKLNGDPRLGVVGTRFIENSEQVYDYKFMNESHVTGCFQLFRRGCFEAIGGYLPLRGGGEDWAAVATARMKGWRTQCYTEMLFVHHRRMGSRVQSEWMIHFRKGQRDYATGGHPVWQVFRSVFQASRKPYLLGGLGLLLGFGWDFVRRAERPVPKDLMMFHRSEQMARLRRLMPFRSKRV